MSAQILGMLDFYARQNIRVKALKLSRQAAKDLFDEIGFIPRYVNKTQIIITHKD